MPIKDQDKANEAPAQPVAPAELRRADEAPIPGGRYINAQGFYVNANGEFIDFDGNHVQQPVKAKA